MRRAAEFETLEKQLANCEANENWQQGVSIAEQLLERRPNDLPVRKRHARAVDRTAVTIDEKTRVLKLFRELALALPDDLEVRERPLELYIELRQHPRAEEEADALLGVAPTSGVAWCVKLQAANAQAQTGASSAAERMQAALPEAVDVCSQSPELASRLAWLLREELDALSSDDRAKSASAVLDRLVERRPREAVAWLARHHFRAAGRLQGAEEDLRQALELAPDDRESLLAAGRWHERRREYPLAQERLERAAAGQPKDRRVYVQLTRVLDRRGRHLQALDMCLAGTKVVGEDDFVLTLRAIEQLIALDRTTEADAALDVLDRTFSEKPPAGPEIERIVVRALLPLVRGIWFLDQRDLALGHDRLRMALRTIEDSGTQRPLADELIDVLSRLAECHKQRAEWDLAATDYERLAEINPDDDQYTTGAAEAWLQIDRVDSAMQVLERVREIRPLTPPESGALARLHWEQESRKPAAKRDWAAMRAALAAAPQGPNGTAGLAILTANERLLSGDPAAAEQTLRGAREWFPGRVEIVEALVQLLERQGRNDEAAAKIADFEEAHPNQATAVLLRGGAYRRAGELAREQELLGAKLVELSAAEQPALLWRLAQSHLQTGANAQAVQVLTELARLRPDRLEAIEQLARLALEANDIAAARNWCERLRQAEGGQGARWRLWLGMLELSLATGPTDSRVLDAARWQTEIEFLRPSWPGGFVLKGAIAEARGEQAAAEGHYRHAIELGDGGPVSHERLVNLLFQQNKLAEAQEFLSSMEGRLGLHRELAALSMASWVQQGNLAQAMALAQQRLDQQPNDVSSYLQRARVAHLAGADIEAGALFEHATKRWPDDANAWQSRLDFYLQAGQTVKVRRLLSELEGGESMAPGDRCLLLATGYERVGNREAADNFYRRALRETPNNTSLLQRTAAFFRNRDDALADRSWRQLLEASPDPGAARRNLAMLLMQRGGEANWAAAEKLLAPSAGEAQQLQTADQRLKATLAVQRGGPENRRLARELLSSIVDAGREATVQDRLLLAQLSAADGLTDVAQRQFDHLLSLSPPPSECLSTYVQWLLKTGRASDATAPLDQLETLQPRSAEVFGLRLRWLAGMGRHDEVQSQARRRLDEAKRQNASRAELESLYQTAAAASDEIQDQGAVRQWFEEGLPAAPKLLGPWTGWLVQHGQSAEAVELCLKISAANGDPRPIERMCGILLQSAALPALRQEAQRAILAATRAHPLDAELLMAAANLWTLENGRRDEAIGLYRKVLELQPENVDALNNSAMLLSEDGARHAEALELVQRAQAAAGNSAGLVDTHAMVLVRMGRADQAIELLQPLVQQPDAMAAWRFHLALAYQAIGKTELAAAQMGLAPGAELQRQLTPGERRALAELNDALKMASP